MKKPSQFPNSDYLTELTRVKILNQILILAGNKLSSADFHLISEVIIKKRNFHEIATRLQIPKNYQKTKFNTAVNKLIKILKNYESNLKREEFERQVYKTNQQLTVKANKGISTEDFLKLKISESDLPYRIKKLCKACKITRVNRLFITEPKKLRRVPNCGVKTVSDIDTWFRKKGLNWVK